MTAVRYLIRRLPLLLILAAAGLLVWKSNSIIDWYKLRGYQPPATISNLASEDTMTPQALHIFYINHPQLVSSSSQFAKDCPQIEQTVVLGCYQSTEDGIYLRTVTDSRLNGVEEVTAAHEMLHGVYDRLSSKDRDYVDGLLMNYYQNDLHDQRIIDTISAYKKSEPKDVVNEMHSVFGTEIANLPQPLETYYARYFTNRSLVTNFTAGYEGEFTSRLDQIKTDEAQLNSLKSQINSEETALDSQSKQLQADRSSLDGLRQSGQAAQYNSQVASFNQEVDSYNSGVNQLRSDISSYNALVAQHNQLADELRGLYSSLGTDLNTQSAQ